MSEREAAEKDMASRVRQILLSHDFIRPDGDIVLETGDHDQAMGCHYFEVTAYGLTYTISVQLHDPN
jgi:hypothetical protein